MTICDLITAESLAQVKVSFATPSLGMHANHTLESKFAALQAAGYKYTELGFGNYMAWVRSLEPDLPASTCPPVYMRDDEPDPSDTIIWDALYRRADDLKALAASYGLQVIIFQPMSQFEGWSEGSHRSDWVREKAKRWLPLCSKLGVTYLQLGSNDQADADSPYEKLVDDVTFLAELGAQQTPPVKISYEPWCFSPRTSDWEGCWEVVKASGHPNLGLCLDTAHVALAPNYGFDPMTGEGYSEKAFQAELARIRALPADKIHFYEISDVIKPSPPLLKGSEFDAYHEDQIKQGCARPLFSWSICGRCVPLVGKDAGQDVKDPRDLGAARCIEVTRAVFETGFRGPCSWEVFEQQYMARDDPTVPFRYAKAGQLSKERLFAAVSCR